MSGPDRLDRRDPVIAELRKTKGATQLRVELTDGKERMVDIPKAGNRWERLAKLLDALAWERIETQDKDGKILGVIEPENDADLDDDEGDYRTGSEFASGAKLGSSIALQAMQTTAKLFAAQMNGQATIMAAVTEGINSIRDSYSLALKVQAANAVAGGEGNEVADMMKMAFALTMAPKQPQPQPQPPPRPQGAPPVTAKNANPKQEAD